MGHVIDIIGRILVVLALVGGLGYGVLWLLAKGMSR